MAPNLFKVIECFGDTRRSQGKYKNWMTDSVWSTPKLLMTAENIEIFAGYMPPPCNQNFDKEMVNKFAAQS